MYKNWSKKLMVASLLGAISLLGIKEASAPLHASEWKSPYVNYVAESNPKLSSRATKEIVVAAYKWSSEFGIDPKLLLAIAKVESNFYPHAISSSGAYGIMQVIPLWHKDKIIKARQELGNPEIFNINTNMYLGAMVLRDCVKKTGKVSKALQCYSGQTPGYDQKVMAYYYKIQRL